MNLSCSANHNEIYVYTAQMRYVYPELISLLVIPS